MNQHTPARKSLFLFLIVGSFLLAAPATAQLRTAESGPYVLRANVVSTGNLPAASLKKYKLRSADFLINVVVLKKGASAPNSGIGADIVVTTRDLVGNEVRVDMQTIKEGTGTSYIGTFDAPLNELELDFEIVAKAAGAQAPIVLQFRERLPRPR